MPFSKKRHRAVGDNQSDKDVFTLGVILTLIGVLSYATQIHNEIKRVRAQKQPSPCEYTMSDIGTKQEIDPKREAHRILWPTPEPRLPHIVGISPAEDDPRTGYLADASL